MKKTADFEHFEWEMVKTRDFQGLRMGKESEFGRLRMGDDKITSKLKRVRVKRRR